MAKITTKRKTARTTKAPRSGSAVRKTKARRSAARLAAVRSISSASGNLFPSQKTVVDDVPGDLPTERQMEIYEFIRDKIHSRGYGPTVREIGLGFKIRSPNGVVCHLKALERKGLISRGKNMSRAIELLAEPAHRRGLPMAGWVDPRWCRAGGAVGRCFPTFTPRY